jgi:hypothetical protein
VLSTPPAFALSQDQTLQFEIGESIFLTLLAFFAWNGHKAGTLYSVFKEHPRREGRHYNLTSLRKSSGRLDSGKFLKGMSLTAESRV